MKKPALQWIDAKVNLHVPCVLTVYCIVLLTGAVYFVNAFVRSSI